MNRYFILAPREMSMVRVRELLKKYLARGPVVFGVSTEPYVDGFSGQPQFRTLDEKFISSLAEKSGGRLTILKYAPADELDVIRETDFDCAIVVNGSNQFSFYLRDSYREILQKKAAVRYVSPFVNEAEARAFADRVTVEFATESLPRVAKNQTEIMALVEQELSRGFANEFQTAAAIVKGDQIIALEHNRVEPYETYAWHHGAVRERISAKPDDIGRFDTVHAETATLLVAGDRARGADIYMRTFPCAVCAKNLIFAGIRKVFYELDYRNKTGYELFDAAGITYRKGGQNESA